MSECQRINSTAEWVWVHKINLLKDFVNKYLLPFHKISHWTFSHWLLCYSNFPLLHKWTVMLVEAHIIIPQQTEGQRCSWLALILAFLPRYVIVTNSVAIYLQVHRWSFPLQLFQKAGLPNTDGFCTAFHDMEFKLLWGNPCTTRVVIDKKQITPWKGTCKTKGWKESEGERLRKCAVSPGTIKMR